MHSPFPEQALGLQILLDQAPRILCTDTDERWRNDYFDHLALGFAKRLRELPAGQSLEKKERWAQVGYSFDHWTSIIILVIAPFAHAEDMECQRVQTSLTCYLRDETERYCGAVDPHFSANPGLAESQDVGAFSRIAKTGGPEEGEHAGVQDHVFWFCWILDAHVPIIRVFGRYPYRNAAVGRVCTEEEERFLEETDRFGEMKDERAKKRIREDVEKGIWTPLGEGKE